MDIQVIDLTKKFGGNLVLDKLSATFSSHEVTCIMGPSGFGKTTLLNIMMGVVSSDSGTVTGVPLKKSAVFQEDRLCENFNAISNVRLVCEKNINDDLISEQLQDIGLKDSMQKPVSKFSGGMRRRVAIVRAMLAESEILFLDEPFKGLDEETKRDTIEYLKKHRNGRTVIMVTHSLEEAKAFDAEIVYIGS